VVLEYTEEQLAELQKTARRGGAVGVKPTAVTRWTEKLAYKGLRILDYGSGQKQIQTRHLRSLKLDVTPYDFNLNPDALNEEWDIIMVSNVINIQPDMKTLRGVFKEVGELLRAYSSFALFNYPKSPRKIATLDDKKLLAELKKSFYEVLKLPDRTVVYKCHM
jgi:hypothetical protein